MLQKEATFQSTAETVMIEAFSQLSDDQTTYGQIIVHHQLTNRGANFPEAGYTARGLTDFVVVSTLAREGLRSSFVLTKSLHIIYRPS
jgi:hypothetical protein